MNTKILISALLASMLYGMPANSQEANDSCKAKIIHLYARSSNGLKLNAADSLFMKKYNVRYVGFKPSFPKEGGFICTTLFHDDCDTYQELDKLYGKKWRKEVNPNAIALKNEKYIRKQSKSARKKGQRENRIIVIGQFSIVPDCF